MKYLIILLLGFIFFSCVPKKQFYNENNCDKIYVDITDGTINGLKPTVSQEKIKEMLPCFTGSTEEGEAFNCGGGVFYLDDDFYFYTYRDFIEIRENFTGDFSENFLGLNRKAIEYKFGEPDKLSNPGEIDVEYYFYKKDYGTLVLKFEADRITTIILSSDYFKDVELCL